MEYNIYVSYSRCDAQIVSAVCYELKKNLSGSKFFMDAETLTVGEDYARKIVSAINETDVFLCFIGENTFVVNGWQMNEINMATERVHQKNIKFIPIILPNVNIDDNKVHTLLNTFEYYKFSSNITDEILEAIKKSVTNKERIYNEAHDNNNEKTNNQKRKTNSFRELYGFSLKKVCIIAFVAFFIGMLAIGGFAAAGSADESSNEEDGSENPVAENSEDNSIVDYSDAHINGSSPYDDENDINSDADPNDDNDVQEDDDNSANDETLDEDIEETNSTNSFLWGLALGVALGGTGIIYLLYKQMRKKAILKVSANKNCEVCVDGHKHFSLNESEIGKIPLPAGKYIIDFKADDRKSMMRYTSDIKANGEDNALVCNFKNGGNDGRRILDIFIAGSTKLEAERNAIRAGISMIYNKWRTYNFAIFSYTFEDFSKSLIINGQQSLYDKFIKEEAEIAVFILDRKIGDKTLAEFNLAYNAFKENGHPRILVYTKENDVTTSDITEVQQLMEEIDNYSISYTDIENLRLSFMETLNWDLINLYKDELKN